MNTSVMHAVSMEAIRPLSNDDRRAVWATKFYAQGHHRRPNKPRIRVATLPAAAPASAGKDSK